MPHWSRKISKEQWKALLAAYLGWTLDAMDVMLYAFALTTIKAEFELSSGAAGSLASVTLISSAAGGILFGVLADRIGRSRSLVITILIYSICSAGTATAQNVWQLAVWRGLLGIGMGGEWSTGSVLVSETWPAHHRGKAIGIMQSGWALGYILAAILTALVLPLFGWRVLFLIGVLPAIVAMWIRRNVPEPMIWREQKRDQAEQRQFAQLLTPPLLQKTVIASFLTMMVLFAYWGVFTWLPGFLSTPVEDGGAGLGIVRTSGWIIPIQIGALLGYISFGIISDRIGRRPAFIAYLVCAAVLVPAYGQLARSEFLLLLLGPAVGFFGSGYFSLFGAMLAELFPTSLRGTGQGTTYNVGRAFSALAPFAIGGLGDKYGLGTALGTTSLFFILGAVTILFLPETKGKPLVC